ncbi:acetyl-CoA acetyltransferase [Myxococcota bacterium]|nr:acetyl-CoA acetyltransferase [Myxococcota bacterium]
MPIDPRTPVLVGVGAIQQRLDDPDDALEPVALMQAALERAAADAGSRALLTDADAIRVPRGFWDYPDPGRWVAEQLGASGVRTQVSEVGVLQSTLFGHAARDIAAGTADIVLLTGGEAKFRALRAQIAGSEASLSNQASQEPDSVLRPSGDIMHRLEIEAGLVTPVQQYSMIENALRAAEGMEIDAHRREVARMWAGMSEVAAKNPAAWNRTPVSADEIRTAAGRNRMLAFPYTKLHNSQWNVDQAAGLILCSAEAARRAGVPESRWVYPWAVTESNHMLSLGERVAPHACPGFAIAGRRALEACEVGGSEVTHREIYSCFPSAVRVQARELEIDLRAPLTVTGGMTFAGGPLNNFVLQAAVRMAQILREDPNRLGMVTAVSGLLTKQGVSLWSNRPPPRGFHFEDVSDAVARATPRASLIADLSGSGKVIAYTVVYEGDEPVRGALLCASEEGRHTLAFTEDRSVALEMTQREFCGEQVKVRDGWLR